MFTRVELDRLVDERWPEIARAAASAPLGLVDNEEYVALIRDFDKVIAKDIFIDDQDELVDPSKATFGHRKLEYTLDNDIFRMQVLYGSGFTKRVKLEMLLWSELQRDAGFSNALVKLSDQITSLTGASTSRVLLQLQTTPLVFVAPSWIPSIEEADLATHKRGYHAGGVRFHLDGIPAPTHFRLRIGEEEADYPLIVSAPRLLCDWGMRELIHDSFVDLLTRRMWLFPDMLQTNLVL